MARTLSGRVTIAVIFASLLLFTRPDAGLAYQTSQQSPQSQPSPKSEGQDPGQEPDAVVRISTRLVQIDAIVTDKNGRHVDDLQMDDFEVTVDGRPQPMTFFKLIRLAAPPEESVKGKAVATSSPAPTTMPTRQLKETEIRRTIALVVDDLGLSFSSTAFAKDALRRFVNEQMGEGDLVAIIRTSSGFGVYQQFTSDKRILHAAIDKLRFALNGRKQIPFTLASTSSLMGRNDVFKTAAEKQHEEMRNRRSPNLDATGDPNADANRNTAMQKALERRGQEEANSLRDNYFSYGTLGALNYVVRSLRPLPGRKLAVVLSDGLPLNLKQGADISRSTDLQRRLLGLVELANRSSVAFYSINVEGVVAPVNDPAVESIDNASVDNFSGRDALNDGLRTLAYETGGLAFFNNNDTDGLLKKAIDDNRSYYLVGFDPEDDKFDRKVHKIKLRVKRNDLKVRTRDSFFGIEDSAAREVPKTREGQLLSAMFSPFGARDIPYQVTSLFFSSTNGEPVIRSYFHIDCSKMKFKDEANGEKTLALELANFTFNEAGAIVESYAKSFTLRFDDARYKRALAEGLTYLNDFPVKKPGAYQFRSALRDASSGLLGSSNQFLQIPDVSKDRMSLSGIILNIVEAQGNGADAAQGEDVLTAKIAANPAARRFATNSELEYLAAIYNPRVDKATGKARLKLQFELYRDGKPIFQSPERPVRTDRQTDPKWLDCGGRFQLKNFSSGEYYLRLVLRDELREGKNAVVDQWVDFSVR